jgi:glucose/arabinose dehydrogenase
VKSLFLKLLESVAFLVLLPTASLYFEPEMDIVAMFIWVSSTGFVVTDAVACMWAFVPCYLIGQMVLVAGGREQMLTRQHALALYVWAAIWGTSSSIVFAFTNIPFEANFFAWMFIVGTALTLVSISIRHFSSSGRALALLLVPIELLRAVGRPLVILSIVLAVSPGALLLAYKSDPSVANVINLMRRNVGGGGVAMSYVAVDALKGDVQFRQPMYVEFPPGDLGYAYVLERKGALMRVAWPSGRTKTQLFSLEQQWIPDDFENGTLGFALHPQFGKTDEPAGGLVFVYFTESRGGNVYNVLARFDLRKDGPEAIYASRFDLLRQQHAAGNGFHNGGAVMFGPDGYLYLAMGDLSSKTSIQGLNKALAGGILRLDVDSRGNEYSGAPRFQMDETQTQGYFIPRDNPLADRSDVFGEYWAWGFRNPYRMQFDRKTGALWVGDVGGAFFEEVNVVKKGGNYQWPFLEGDRPDTRRPKELEGTEHPPYHFYKHTAVDRAIIGGFVYRATGIPEARDKYVYADNGSGRVVALDLDTDKPTERDLARVDQLGQLGISSVQESPEGDILIIVLGSKERPTGKLLKLVRSDGKPVVSRVEPVDEATLAGVSERFRSECSRCHALDGSGDEKLGAQLGVKMPNFTSSEWQSSRTDKHIEAVIRGGGAVVGMSPLMPAWAGALSASEIQMMVKVVRGFRTSAQ